MPVAFCASAPQPRSDMQRESVIVKLHEKQFVTPTGNELGLNGLTDFSTPARGGGTNSMKASGFRSGRISSSIA
eukprot:6145290-Karenia_brevis.AAC.1